MKDLKERVEYIDIAKGIGILLVILGHVVYDGNYPMKGAGSISDFIFSFHMPLFFIISGFCIKDSKKLDKSVLLKMARIYLLPYAIWSVLYVAAFQLFYTVHYQSSFISLDNHQFCHAISDCGIAPLWFLLALFISEVLVIAIKSLIKAKYWRYCLLIILAGISIVCSYWYNTIDNINILSQNWIMGTFRIVPTTFYVFLGYLMKDQINRLSQLRKKWIVIAIATAVQVLLCFVWTDSIDVHIFILGNPWLYFIKGINGSLMIILIAQTVHSKLLIKLGQKTKELMILHYPPFFYTLLLGYLLGKLFAPNVLGMIIIWVVTIGCCLFIDWLFSRFKVYRFIMGRE